MIYVLSIDGKILMPTHRDGRVQRLLESCQAKVIRQTPFTIQLLYETTAYVQAPSMSKEVRRQIGFRAAFFS